MIGYQSDDGKWSVSFAAMFISSFNQDWEGSAGAMMLEGDVELDRRDYDLAVNYTFSKYFKAYAGYKYQDMDLDFELTFNTGLGAQTDTFDIEADAHIPTFGIGAAYPVHDQVVIGGQIGVLYPLMDMEITNEDGRTDDIIPHSRIGFNTEANITYQPWEHLIIQAGYRYQEFTFKARGPGRTDIIKSVDKTYGPTLSAFYMF
jgi:opacity protein-like surface antigen